MTPADAASTVQCCGRGMSPAITLTMGDGATFMPLPLPPNATSPACSSLGFSASFSFLITSYDPMNGFTFSLLTSPAMGQGGNQLGYGGLSGLAVEFDSRADGFDPADTSADNHVGIDVGGSLISLATSPLPFRLSNEWSVLKHAVIQYDPTTQLLSVHVYTDSASSLEPLLTRYLDLCSALKLQSTSVAPTLYVGFTGGGGKYFIYDWQVSTGENPVLVNFTV